MMSLLDDFPNEHPSIFLVFCTIFGMLAVLALFATLLETSDRSYHYIGVDGNEGDAKICSAQGSLKCCTNDGRSVQVMEFRRND